jgi:hypothetical protein
VRGDAALPTAAVRAAGSVWLASAACGCRTFAGGVAGVGSGGAASGAGHAANSTIAAATIATTPRLQRTRMGRTIALGRAVVHRDGVIRERPFAGLHGTIVGVLASCGYTAAGAAHGTARSHVRIGAGHAGATMNDEPLQRRVDELEARVARLEAALAASGAPSPASSSNADVRSERAAPAL